ncbi:hypothetical protein DFH07DRAFT_973812 [Mycena maculata]|uniref:Uncharacterized protein n=1 Tax=Mycena maculata TaxID=230809 RepID=A0AAD7HBX6_9AGAR|nr:hypothetical protein DFH07DRAFT_973812 [Mycena maculata]
MLVVGRRCVSNLPVEFEGLFREKVPLDSVVNRLARNRLEAPLEWPAPPPRQKARELAKDIRAHIANNDLAAALGILRKAQHGPCPRLLVHTTVHALLRIDATQRAGGLLLSFVSQETTATRAPRMHPKTLHFTMLALLSLAPKTQSPQDWSRTMSRPAILRIDAAMVSHPPLRTALALSLAARRRFVPRSPTAIGDLWQALLGQREWIAAAHIFFEQVIDYRHHHVLRYMLADPDSHLHQNARMRLAKRLEFVNKENVRPNRSLFSRLCDRVAGVLQTIARRRGAASTDDRTQDDKDAYEGKTHHWDVDFDASASEASPSDSFSSPPHSPQRSLLHDENDDRRWRVKLRENWAQQRRMEHQSRLALQTLSIIGSQIQGIGVGELDKSRNGRCVPWGEVGAWVIAVGSIPPIFAPIQVYTRVLTPSATEHRYARLPARAHLRDLLEGFARALPRTPHVCSIPSRDGPWNTPVRRGLRPDAATTTCAPNGAGATANADSANDSDGHDVSGESRSRHVPPADAADAADDSLMPPPSLSTYEALLGVFLRAPGWRGQPPMGAVFELARFDERTGREGDDDSTTQNHNLDNDERAVDGRALEGKEAETEAQLWNKDAATQHWHAPRSPNNERQGLSFPAHPLDFSLYPSSTSNSDSPEEPAVSSNSDSAPHQGAHAERHRMDDDEPARLRLACTVLSHMLHLRNPPLPPWESEYILRLLAARRPAFERAARADDIRAEAADERAASDAGAEGTSAEVEVTHARELWEAVWAGAAARREAEARAAQSSSEYQYGQMESRPPDAYTQALEHQDAYANGDGVAPMPDSYGAVDLDQGRGMFLRREADVERVQRAELDRFNRRLAAKEREQEEARYRAEVE